MSARNILALILIFASLICLYPGLTFDMMTIKVHADVPIVGQLEMYQATQSIVQTIESLFADNNNFVACLILLFSVLVPILKTVLVFIVLLFQHFSQRQKTLAFVSAIGKWSMADVFVVSVFMAVLVTRSNANIEAYLHEGFYYFSAYCLLSILGTQLIQLAGSATPASAKPA